MRNKNTNQVVDGNDSLILAIPVVGSAQFYNRDRYDRSDRRDVHDAIVRLDNSSARLEKRLELQTEDAGCSAFSGSATATPTPSRRYVIFAARSGS